MQGLVNGNLITLELCCSPTLPFPQELSDTYPKETQQSALHILLLLAVLHRAGCPEQPQARCPGGVPAQISQIRVGGLSLAGSAPRFVRSLLLQSRYKGGITLLQTSPGARCPCPNTPAGQRLHRVTTAQTVTLGTAWPSASCGSADAYLCHEAAGMCSAPAFFSPHRGFQVVKIPLGTVIAAVLLSHPSRQGSIGDNPNTAIGTELKSNHAAPNSNVLISRDGHFNLRLIGLKASDGALEGGKMQICNESAVTKDNQQRSAVPPASHGTHGTPDKAKWGRLQKFSKVSQCSIN